jgi:hypothetical protein
MPAFGLLTLVGLGCIVIYDKIQRGWTMIVDSLTEDLFSLDEPWRERFLRLVVNRVTTQADKRYLPTPEDVTTWFRADPALRRKVSLLLYLWQGPSKRRPSGPRHALPREHRGNRLS